MPGSRTPPSPPQPEFRQLERSESRILYADDGWVTRISVAAITVGFLGVMLWFLLVLPLVQAVTLTRELMSGPSVRQSDTAHDAVFLLVAVGIGTTIAFWAIRGFAANLPRHLTRHELELIPSVRTATLRTLRLFGAAATARTLDPADFAAVQLWTKPWGPDLNIRLACVGLVRSDGSIWNADRGCDMVPIRRLAEDLAATLRLPLDEHGVVNTDHPD